MSDQLRVLLVEDNPGDADLLQHLLSRAGAGALEVSCVARLSEALESVAARRFDIVLLDLGLPDSFGLATLRTMRRQAAKLPIIVLTGNNDEQAGLDAIREGAQDYLIKGHADSNLLTRSITYAVERSRSENALKELNDTLEERIAERTAQISAANETLRLEIVERKRAEEAQRHTKEQWERTFASVPDLIAILDNRHRVLRVNEAMARRLGLAPEECVGRPCYEVVHGALGPPCYCPHTRTLHDGGKHAEEVHLEQFGGHFLITTAPLLDENGIGIGSIHIAHDITERKLIEKGLQQAKESAEATTRTKSQFLANMSHELRTPMTGVLGMLDLALSGNLEPEQRNFIDTARTSARALVRILNDILDLTKIEMGKLELEEKQFSMATCLENTYNLLLTVARGKGLDLDFSLADDVPRLLVGDQTRLNQVLTNLVGNAIKFTEKGKVGLLVSAGASSGGKRELVFAVTDTGIGIPGNKEHLLFRFFSQVDESHSRSYGGTGLGLAISKEIVERMGGSISFTSEEGIGSVFTCRIPLAEAGIGSGVIFPAAGKPSRGPELCGVAAAKKARLLVAEDDQVVRQVLESMLQRSGYAVCFAGNGQEAVDMWEAGSFDLVLMDVQMPRMNGFQATAAIREKERGLGVHIPIVAMTAHALKKDEERCLDAGMDAYISKPIDFLECLALIRETLKTGSVR